MKKILSILFILISFAASAQLQKFGKHRIDSFYIKSAYSSTGAARMLIVDTVTNKIFHQAIPSGGSGISALGAIGSSPNANGATISGSTLNLEPANAANGGVVTTTTQTFAGQKAFNHEARFKAGTMFQILSSMSTADAGFYNLYAHADGFQYIDENDVVKTLAIVGGDVEFGDVINRPTTLSGYGIGDGVTLTGSETLTNKTISGADNTINNLNASNLSSGTVDAARLPAISGALVNIRYLTSGTSYTPTSGTTKIDMVVIGAGGGGGGASGANTQVGAGAGGGSGAILRKSMVTVSDATSYTYAIGTAGTAGANSGGNGGTGGNSSITISGTTYTANGGVGGTGQTAGTALAVTLGGASGASTNGDVNGGGQNGDNGVRLSSTVGISGAGGTSLYGAGGAALSTAGAGNTATGHGAGGGGALSTANTNRAGGAGSAGLIIIYEYK
jgi:hypothetical protein